MEMAMPAESVVEAEQKLQGEIRRRPAEILRHLHHRMPLDAAFGAVETTHHDGSKNR